MTTVSLDLTSETTAAESLRQLDPGQREQVLHALQHMVSADNDAAIMANIRETLIEEYPWVDGTGKRRPFVGGEPVDPDSPLPVGVVFTTTDWDDGNFLTDTGRVLLDNGQVDLVTFTGLADLFTEEFGPRGPRFALGIDLRTGEQDLDDYGGEEDIHARFGIAAPPDAPADAEETPLDAAGLVAMLGARGRDALREALHDADRVAAETAMLHAIRATLAEQPPGHRTAAGVLFTADERPGLNHLSSDGLVVYTDGTASTVSFTTAEPILTDRYGTGEATRSLAVDLRTEAFEVADDTLDVHAHLGLPSPAQS